MRVECQCGAIVELDDADVRRYVSSLMGSVMTERKKAALCANAKKPRPGSRGNQRAKKKEVKP